MASIAKITGKAALGLLGVLLARSCSATVVRFPLSSIAVSSCTPVVDESITYILAEHSASTPPY